MDRLEELIRGHINEESGKAKLEKTSGCPDEAELSAYMSGKLGDDRTAKVEEHIVACHFCLESLRSGYLAESLYDQRGLSDTPADLLRRAKSIHKTKATKRRIKSSLWLLATLFAFVLSFVFPRYFAQFLVAALILGLKWVFESENARTLVMVINAWRHHSHNYDEEIKDRIKRF